MSRPATVLALIPARSGSKGIIDKNIRNFLGKPLLVHSIDHARSARSVGKIVVSTDSEQYREIAVASGAEAPFLRPASISGDKSTDLEVFLHALNWLEENESYRPDFCVHLRPTCPTRDPAEIDRMVDLLKNSPNAESIRSVTRSPIPPHKMWFIGKSGFLEPVAEAIPGIAEPWNVGRQLLPEGYVQNAAIDVVRSSVVLSGSMTGTRILPFEQEFFHDIDTETEMQAAEEHVHFQVSARKSGPKTFVVDIDGVLASIVSDNNYSLASPISANIELVNLLFQAGHEIILFTARGSKTGIDWSSVTRGQMERWGVRHHRLLYGKPAADFYIDDRAATPAKLISLAQLCG